MIGRVNSWDLVNYNWPIDTRISPVRVAQEKQQQQSLYIFDYRDEPYRHVYGGPWTLFQQYTPARHIDTRA